MSFGITNAKAKKGSNNLSFDSVVVETTDWVASVVYNDYPYQATIINDASLVGFNALDGFITFNSYDADSGNYSNNATLNATLGTITIYARTIPNANITIPNILVVGV